MKNAAYSREGFSAELAEFAFIPNSTIGHLSSRINKGVDATDALKQSWSFSYNNGLVIDEGSIVSFPIWEDGKPSADSLGSVNTIATLKPNRKESISLSWAITYAGPDNRRKLRTIASAGVPSWILDFSYIPWKDVLEDVSNKALAEPWDVYEGDKEVLRSFLTYTFQRAALQGRVAVDVENGFAAFNTGLVSPTFDDLYMCFNPNYQKSPEWSYAGVCIAGERGLGKKLVQSLANLPERASYFEDVNDLIFDTSRDMYIDTRHIAIDNVDRLPVAFLRQQFHDKPELLSELDNLERLNKPSSKDYKTIRNEIENDPDLLLRLKDRIDDAVKLAKKRTQWNYRTAIPCYYPVADDMSMLLPLCLQDKKTSDAALVVSLSNSGNYQGETILTLQMAYVDARLICRPENDWLVLS